MPEISVAASPVAAAATPPAPGSAAAAPDDGSATVSFAAVLKQLAGAGAPPLPTLKPELPLTAGDEAPVDATGLASLLPWLMASLAPATPASPTTPTTAQLSGDDQPLEGASPLPETLLAAPLPIAPQGQTPLPAPAAAPSAETAAMPAANAAAILAAAPDTAGLEAAVDSQGGFESLLAGSRETAAALSAATAPPAQPAPPAPARIDVPVGAAGWDAKVGDQMVWMANRQESRAELVLTPPQFGRIEISLTVSGDQANAIFIAANPTTREALENALPRLREILADAGLTLGQAHVGAESQGQSANGQENRDNFPRSTSGAAMDATASGVTSAPLAQWTSRGRSLVDIFA